MDRILRKREVVKLVGLSHSTIWRLERSGRFPRRVQLGASSVGWSESEIQAWQEKIKLDRQTPATI